MNDEMARLSKKWNSEHHWPLLLNSVEIRGIRGWTGQRVEFGYPLIAIVGENGVGKSTILQAIASVYRAPESDRSMFASKFFPDTTWDVIRNAEILYEVTEGERVITGTIHKPTNRWRETPDRRRRSVRYYDLCRIQPLATQTGYSRLAKPACKESQREQFDANKSKRFSSIIGRPYSDVCFSLTDADERRWVPVLERRLGKYSGFHQGSGETSLADLLRHDIPKYSIVLIDEIEASLHPRAQRRLIRDLASLCRTLELQVILTTHSPFILQEIPPEGRICIVDAGGVRTFMTGISPKFAMTEMDEDSHPEITIFVEDETAKIMVEEIIACTTKTLVRRCEIVPFGAANVGKSLGQMVEAVRFPRPTLVFLDGDQDDSPGCHKLPGTKAPEVVVFSDLQRMGWPAIHTRINREKNETFEALERATLVPDHHDWVNSAADRLVSPDLWRILASTWAALCCSPQIRESICELIETTIGDKITILTPKPAAVSLKTERKIESESTPKVEPPRRDKQKLLW